MTSEKLKTKLYALIQKCEDLIDKNMLDCGDTSEESQKIALINALYEFEKNVNGIE